VRERLAALLDEGSFHEIGRSRALLPTTTDGALTGFTRPTSVVGTGRIAGRKVVAGGDDFTIRGGAADAGIIGKQIYAEQLANQLRLPLVRLVEGTGGGGSVKTLEQTGHTYVPANPGWDYVVDKPVHGAGGGRRPWGRSPALAPPGCAWRTCRSWVDGHGSAVRGRAPVVKSGSGEDVDKEPARRLPGARPQRRRGPGSGLGAGRVPDDPALPVLPAAERVRAAAGHRVRGPGRAAGPEPAVCRAP